jgi:cytochrome c peroxidase
MKLLPKALLTTLFSLAAAGCGDASLDEQPVPIVEDGSGDVQGELTAQELAGQTLFKFGTFSGNGRTCSTCHAGTTGSLSPAQVQAAWNANPNGPLFRKIDSDDGTGASYSKLKTHATVNVAINLPSNIRLSGSSARSVTLRRAIPGTIDMPKLDTMIMYDGRAATLQAQATGAIAGHAQAGRAPKQYELDSIAAYEKTLFSSNAMRDFANGAGPMPALPAGTTASEQRGAAFFAPTALCGSCHGGALLNTNQAGNPLGLPAGTQFGTSLASEANRLNNPVTTYLVRNAQGVEESVTTADPGMMLITGNKGDANLFKMLSLRNLKNTAPYFHDGSAKTLDEIMVQYDFVLTAFGIPHTAQDLADMKAFMLLL